MRILFKNARTLEGGVDSTLNVLIDGKIISYIGKETPEADKIIECNGNLLMPAFFNAHCHSAMTLFRGYGDDLPLQRWLHEKIFPLEDRLNDEIVTIASKLAAAEMIKNGIVSFTDMYSMRNEQI